MKKDLTNIFSGLALGALVGFLIGLSISQVVGVVLGALTSLLVTFFGLSEKQEILRKESKSLISFFCIGCFLFILLGVYLRSRNSLAPSAGYYVNELKSLHLDSNQIKEIVLLKMYGVAVEKQGNQTIKNDPSAQVSGTIFSTVTVQESKSIRRRYENLSLIQLGDLLRQQGQVYEQFYNTVDTEITDSTSKKNIVLQFIASTYKNDSIHK